MNNNSFVLATVILGSIALTSSTFAAYWWWGGWSSVGSSSLKNTVILSRDVCPSGDYSASYYDWTCWTNPTESITNQEITPSTTFAKQAVKKPTPFVFKTETKEKLKEKIAEQQKIKKQVIKMPIKYMVVQRKIDTIMTPREFLSSEMKVKKAVTLFEKTELLLEKKSLSPKIEAIIVYLQQKAISMIQNAWSL